MTNRASFGYAANDGQRAGAGCFTASAARSTRAPDDRRLIGRPGRRLATAVANGAASAVFKPLNQQVVARAPIIAAETRQYDN